MEVLNIKKDKAQTDVAVSLALIEIDTRKKFGNKIFKVIHGYGSHGVGGDIKRDLHQKLEKLKKEKFIRDFIKGETFTTFKVNQLKLAKEELDLLIIDEDYNNFNPGHTIIIV